MQFAIYNTERKEAEPGLKGTCPHCRNEVIAKCGSKNIWHWAHTKTENCDSWYEPETLWHRDWKNQFGKEYSEIRVQKETGFHIADVVNKEGIVFEFQNSSISGEVIRAREEFYGDKMIWVINGISFKDNFRIYEETFIKKWKFTILDEFSATRYKEIKNSLIIEDWQIQLDVVKDFLKNGGFIYNPIEKIYSLDLNLQKYNNREQLIFKLYNEIFELYPSNKEISSFMKAEFTWEHFRRSWQESQRPVFIDFGENFLFLVKSGIGKKSGSGTKISRAKFMEKYC